MVCVRLVWSPATSERITCLRCHRIHDKGAYAGGEVCYQLEPSSPAAVSNSQNPCSLLSFPL